MQELKDNDDGISIKELIVKISLFYNYLYSRKLYLIIGAVLGAILGVAYAYSYKPMYTADCTFVLEESDRGGLGQYSGLAAVAGIDLGSGRSNGIFQGDNIIELYRSREMLKKTLLSPIVINGKKTTLLERYIEFNELRKTWDKNPEMKNIQFPNSGVPYSVIQNSVLFSIIGDIKGNYLTVARPDKKMNIIDVSVKCEDEIFARDFVNKIVDNVNSFYRGYKTKKSVDNLTILQNQADSVRHALDYSLGSSATAMDANPNANLSRQILKVPSQKRQIDVAANSAIYSEVEKNLFVTKMSLMNETPLIQVLDRPEFPLDKMKYGKFRGLVMGAFLGAFFALLCFGARDLFRKFSH